MDTQNQHKEHWLNLIIDRLTGTISEDSDLCLQEWIHASDENSRYFKNMELLWHSMEVVHEGEQYVQTVPFCSLNSVSRQKTR